MNFKPFWGFPPLFYSDFPLPFGSGWLTRGGVPPKPPWDPPSLAQPAGHRRGPGLTPRLSQLATGPSCGPLAPAAPTPPRCCPTGYPVPRSIPPRPHGSRIPSPWQPSHPPRVPQITAPPCPSMMPGSWGRNACARVCRATRVVGVCGSAWGCVHACAGADTRGCGQAPACTRERVCGCAGMCTPACACKCVCKRRSARACMPLHEHTCACMLWGVCVAAPMHGPA